MNKKDDLRVIKTRKLIYQTLLELMKEKTFEEIKVSDICSKAMINRSTFYAHYEDKYELLVEFLNDLKEEFKNQLDKNSKNLNNREYYIELIKLFLEHVESKKEIYNSILINNRNSIMMDIILSVVNNELLTRINNEQRNAKVPNEIIAKFYLGGVIYMGITWLNDSSKYTKEEMIEYLSVLIPDNF